MFGPGVHMQRGKLDSTLARCPRHPYPCGVASLLVFGALPVACSRAKHPALATLGQENLEGITGHGKMTIGVKKLIELVSSCSI